MHCRIVRPLIPDHFSQILFKLVWLTYTLKLGILGNLNNNHSTRNLILKIEIYFIFIQLKKHTLKPFFSVKTSLIS